jgi:hypothetical protein
VFTWLRVCVFAAGRFVGRRPGVALCAAVCLGSVVVTAAAVWWPFSVMEDDPLRFVNLSHLPWNVLVRVFSLDWDGCGGGGGTFAESLRLVCMCTILRLLAKDVACE